MPESKESQPMPKETVGENPAPTTKPPPEEAKIRVTDKRFWVRAEEDGAEQEPVSSLKPTYVEELEQKRSEAEKKVEEIVASYREFRANAEAENRQARERIKNEYQKRVRQAQGEMVQKFIDIFENFERALIHARESPDLEGLLKGVELIHNQFGAVLAELGLEEVVKVGEPYNPELAEAVAVTEVFHQEEDNCVLEVVRKGYRLNQKLVRPARVRVGQAKTTADPDSD